MPRVNFTDLVYAIRHPSQAYRYLLHRDRISYAACADYLPGHPTIVEAGAYDGTNTGDFCRFWPECQVYAFEPVPSAYERLMKVAADFPERIHPQNMALGSQAGFAEMHISVNGTSGGEQSSSLLSPTRTREEFPFVGFCEETVTVPVTRLDEWAEINNVNRIDFLWFDLQGFELAALEGCGDLLSSVSAIHCEVQNLPLYEGAPLYPEIAQWLGRKGFHVAHKATFRRGGNVLFVQDK
jgi:FkbM family methyltransferase